jgi:hypothetical protein
VGKLQGPYNYQFAHSEPVLYHELELIDGLDAFNARRELHRITAAGSLRTYTVGERSHLLNVAVLFSFAGDPRDRQVWVTARRYYTEKAVQDSTTLFARTDLELCTLFQETKILTQSYLRISASVEVALETLRNSEVQYDWATMPGYNEEEDPDPYELTSLPLDAVEFPADVEQNNLEDQTDQLHEDHQAESLKTDRTLITQIPQTMDDLLCRLDRSKTLQVLELGTLRKRKQFRWFDDIEMPYFTRLAAKYHGNPQIFSVHCSPQTPVFWRRLQGACGLLHSEDVRLLNAREAASISHRFRERRSPTGYFACFRKLFRAFEKAEARSLSLQVANELEVSAQDSEPEGVHEEASPVISNSLRRQTTGEESSLSPLSKRSRVLMRLDVEARYAVLARLYCRVYRSEFEAAEESAVTGLTKTSAWDDILVRNDLDNSFGLEVLRIVTTGTVAKFFSSHLQREGRNSMLLEWAKDFGKAGRRDSVFPPPDHISPLLTEVVALQAGSASIFKQYDWSGLSKRDLLTFSRALESLAGFTIPAAGPHAQQEGLQRNLILALGAPRGASRARSAERAVIF